jgi:hypothetical protein
MQDFFKSASIIFIGITAPVTYHTKYPQKNSNVI